MNLWLIIALGIGVLAITGFAVASLSTTEESVEIETKTTSSATCGGGCSAGNTCGNPSCGATQGKPCGCNG